MQSTALLMRGFRPFFAGAAVFAILAMVIWLIRFLSPGLLMGPVNLSASQWHAHEMVYGYAMAVIAGFLLTAAQNWTGVTTLHGRSLGILVALWAAARIAMMPGFNLSAIAAACDLLFAAALLVAIAYPVIRVRQKRQFPVLLVLLLLLAGNLGFYLGLGGYLETGTWTGINAGFYLVLGMVLFMGRRVIPFFAEGGTGNPVKISRPRWIDVSLFIMYPIFLAERVFWPSHPATLVSACLFIVTAVQILTWHVPGISSRPLLWSLYLAFGNISAGFLLQTLARWFDIPVMLPVHAFAVGGIGMITLGMMARVSLGHTGRNIHEPGFIVSVALVLLLLATLARVLMPLIHTGLYDLWIATAGVCWIMAFSCFAFCYLPMLAQPRLDGKPG